MIPVYLKTDSRSADDPIYYVVAANGTFLVRRTALFTATTRVNEIIGLESHDEQISLSFQKVPRVAMEQILGFFTWVYRRWDGEAIVFLYYHPDRGEFRVEVPRQTLPRFRSGQRWHTAGHVEYGSVERPDGFLKLGDAHSHADSPAFFSKTDDHDDQEDGLRIVVGRLDVATVEMCASFVVSGCRFSIAADDVVEIPSDPFSPAPPPEEWTRRVVCRDETPPNQVDRWDGHGH